MAKNLFDRYIWLIDTIRRAGSLTFEGINERWVRSPLGDGTEMPLRTFHNHRAAIEELFNIRIGCEKRGGYRYFIDGKREGRNAEALLNALSVNALLNGDPRLSRRIVPESEPSGNQYLTAIAEAMRKGLSVQITYQSPWRSEAETLVAEPYFVKAFGRHWYMVARTPHDGKTTVFALDGIRHLLPTEAKYKFPRALNANSFFADSFGAVMDEECAVETVRLRVYGNMCNYLNANPLHHSQNTVETLTDSTVFEYQLRPTPDFRQALLALGSAVEVLKPKWFRKQQKEAISEMAKRYKK